MAKTKQMSKVNLLTKYPPSKISIEKLKEMDSGSKKGLELLILLSMGDCKTYTEKEIKERVGEMQIVVGIELCRRDGLLEVSKNFNWFTNWKAKAVKMKCPNCNTVWELGKVWKQKNCPVCGLDLIALAEKMFPNLKKLRKSAKKKKK